VTNYGPDNATGVVVTDVLDPRLTFVSATGGSFTRNGSTIIWNIGNLNVGSVVNLYITVRVNGTGNIVNVANLTNVTQNNTGNNSTGGNNSTITVPPTVNLTITKSSNVTNASLGDLVSYRITVTNHGPDNATGVYVTDNLDSRLEFVNSTGAYDPNTGIWTIGNLDVGQSVTLNITVRILNTGNIVNIAYVTVDQPNIGNNSSGGNNSTITVRGTVNFTFTKTANVTIAGDGDYILYTIVVTNHGPHNSTNVIVTDFLSSLVTFDYSSASQGSYDPITGLWTIGNLDVGQTVTLLISVMKISGGNIFNDATITSNDNNLGNNFTRAIVGYLREDSSSRGEVNLTITKSVNVTGKAKLGDTITFTIVVSNQGQSNATNVRVTDILDTRLVYINSSATVGFYDPLTGLWNIGNLNVGQNVTLNITVRINGTGIIENIATLSSYENNIGDNLASISVEVPLHQVLDLEVDDGKNGKNGKNGDNTHGPHGKAGIGMKDTGMPMNAIGIIALLLFSLLALIFKRRISL